MGEQRFVLDKLYYTIMTPVEKISVGRSYMTYGEVVGCLNKQQSIIDEQKIAIDELINDYKKLEEENEQLRKENVFLTKQRTYWKRKRDVAVETFEIDEATAKKIKELEKQNEQLQKELNNYEKLTNLLADYDVHHYNRWINQIKNYVEKTNEGFEYNREFIIKLCLSYTLQSLRNGENLKRFRWDMVNNE